MVNSIDKAWISRRMQAANVSTGIRAKIDTLCEKLFGRFGYRSYQRAALEKFKKAIVSEYFQVENKPVANPFLAKKGFKYDVREYMKEVRIGVTENKIPNKELLLAQIEKSIKEQIELRDIKKNLLEEDFPEVMQYKRWENSDPWSSMSGEEIQKVHEEAAQMMSEYLEFAAEIDDAFLEAQG